jgi:outer membrane protein assembly factor BamB
MATGEPVWEAKRPVGNSWTTPIVIATPRGEQLITSANPFVISYEPSTGKELWRADCMGGDVAPSPIYAKDLVFAVNLDAELVAIRPDGVGDVTETHIAWRGEDGLPDIVSPLSDGELLFVVTTSGKVTCYDVASGEVVWAEKLKLPCNSSPSLVGKLVHLWTQKGVLLVFEAAREYKEVGRSELGEEVNASAAFAPGRVYVRGARSLYCLGKR